MMPPHSAQEIIPTKDLCIFSFASEVIRRNLISVAMLFNTIQQFPLSTVLFSGAKTCSQILIAVLARLSRLLRIPESAESGGIGSGVPLQSGGLLFLVGGASFSSLVISAPRASSPSYRFGLYVVKQHKP